MNEKPHWIKGRIEKYSFVEGEDFTVDKFINGRATVVDYYLTIEIGKELAMVENNDKGDQVRITGKGLTKLAATLQRMAA